MAKLKSKQPFITMLKINFLGDSITEGAMIDNPDKCFVTLVGNNLHCITRNYGVSGTRIGKALEPSDNPRFDLYFASRVQDMDDDADYIFIFGGTNDYGAKVKFGQIGDKTSETFCGGVYETIQELLKKYKKEQIVFIVQLYREDEQIPLNRSNDGKPGRVLQDYRDALIEVVKSFDIKLLDIKDIIGRGENNPLLVDGLHPNEEGHRVIAKLISDYVLELENENHQ